MKKVIVLLVAFLLTVMTVPLSVEADGGVKKFETSLGTFEYHWRYGIPPDGSGNYKGDSGSRRDALRTPKGKFLQLTAKWNMFFNDLVEVDKVVYVVVDRITDRAIYAYRLVAGKRKPGEFKEVFRTRWSLSRIKNLRGVLQMSWYNFGGLVINTGGKWKEHICWDCCCGRDIKVEGVESGSKEGDFIYLTPRDREGVLAFNTSSEKFYYLEDSSKEH